MKQLEYILANETEVLTFLKSQYPVYHLSNIFFRDIQYGIQTMLDRRNMSVGYADAEKIAKALVAQLEKKKILNPIDKQSWVMNYPDFRKPVTKPAAPATPAAKPAAPAAAAPGATKPSLPPLSRPVAGAAKPGGLPPLSRPVAGSAKPSGLPPLSRPVVAATPTPAPVATPQHVESVAPAVTPAAVDAPRAATTPPTAPAPKAVPPGGRKPLPPLRSSTPSGKK